MRHVALLLLLACGCSTGGASAPNGAGASSNASGASGGASGAAGSTAGNSSALAGAANGGASSSVSGGAAGAGGTAGASSVGAAGIAGAAGVSGGGSAGASGVAGAGGGPAQPPKASGILCVFDYDLTLSTNNCKQDQFACRTNACLTYNWYQQCMSSGARHAIEVCVDRGAYIGIASHASVDSCWNDKVTTIVSQAQFPALTGAVRYDNASTDFSYPKLDVRDNWNCDTCAYHMNGAFSKPQLISKVMAHYGMDPKSAADRAKVIFWDDLPDNITKTNAAMPEVHTVHVHENVDGQPNSGGCGILESDVDAGWAPFPQ